MATLSLTTIAADVRTEQIETATWKARKALSWWAGEHLNDKERARLLEDIVDFIAKNEPWNCPPATITNAMLFKGHQCSEYVVRKMLDEYIEKAITYNAARKAEESVK